MRQHIRLGLLVTAIAAAAAPSQAEAADLRLGLGADYWAVSTAVFDLNLSVHGRLTRGLAVGGRFGALMTSYNTTIGIPLDFSLRGTIANQLYLEGLVGPWLLFGGPLIRAHAALGFGIQTGGLSLGLEVGWLDPAALVGLRLGFRL